MGTPTGFNIIQEGGIRLNNISLISTTPAIGSPAGTLITAVVAGLTPDRVATLTLSNNTDICQSVYISFGILECQTKPGSVPT